MLGDRPSKLDSGVRGIRTILLINKNQYPAGQRDGAKTVTFSIESIIRLIVLKMILVSNWQGILTYQCMSYFNFRLQKL